MPEPTGEGSSGAAASAAPASPAPEEVVQQLQAQLAESQKAITELQGSKAAMEQRVRELGEDRQVKVSAADHARLEEELTGVMEANLNDPKEGGKRMAEVLRRVTSQTARTAQEAAERAAYIAHIKTQKRALMPFEATIASEANRIMMTQGKSFQDAVDQAVEIVEALVKPASSAAASPAAPRGSQGHTGSPALPTPTPGDEPEAAQTAAEVVAERRAQMGKRARTYI